jgi:hypothetical protein
MHRLLETVVVKPPATPTTIENKKFKNIVLEH